MPRLIAENIKSQILPLYKSGLSYREVGDRLGISHITVGRYVRESGYDRTHVGSKIAKSIPIANERPQKPSEAPQSRDTFRVISRTQKLQSGATGFSYTVSTDSDIIEIESASALMQINVAQIDSFIQELESIRKMLGNPS